MPMDEVREASVSDVACQVDDVVITSELERRPSRAPDFEAENQALASLAEAMESDPETVLQQLAQVAMNLTNSESAGISLLEPGAVEGVFRWAATAGAWAPYAGGTMPRGESPCGEVIARESLLLVANPDRAFPALSQADPPIHEGLLAPFQIGGRLAGTVWVIKHSADKHFEKEDARLLSSFAHFASVAHRVVEGLEDARTGQAALRESEERQAFLLKLSDALRSESDPEMMAQVACRLLVEQIDASRAQFTVMADNTPGAEIAEVCGEYVRHGAPMVRRFPMSAYGSGFVDILRSGRTLVLTDLGRDPRVSEAERDAFRAVESPAAVAVPRVNDGRLAITFAVHNREPREWTGREITLIEDVAGRTWAAVERARAEVALQQSEAKYRSLFETMGQGYVLAETVRDANGQAVDMRLLEVNPAYERLMGVSAEEARGRCAYEILPGVDRWWLETCDRIARAGQPERVEYQYSRDGGWFEAWVYPRGQDRYEVLFEDITERKRAETALRQSESRFSEFAANSADTLWIVDVERNKLEYLSPAFENMWGEGRDKIMADLGRWIELVHPDDRDSAAKVMARSADGEPAIHTYRIIRPDDGRTCWIRDTGFPMPDSSGRIRRVGGISQEVTDWKETDIALAMSESRWRSLAEGIPQLVWRSVDHGVWTWASTQWEEFTGLSSDDSSGWGWLDAVHPEDRQVARDAWEKARDSGTFGVEYRLRRQATGEYRWFQTRALAVMDDRADLLEWLGTLTDIDELRTLQRHQQVLLAELQHRVRNTLSVVRSIARRTAENSESVEDMVAHFQGRLDAFSRVQAALTRNPDSGVDLMTIVEDELVAHAAREGEHVRIDGPEVILPTRTAENLSLAIHELATNAVKYGALSNGGGKVAVGWRFDKADGSRELVLNWTESGVAIDEPEVGREGFGMQLLRRSLPYDLRGETDLTIGRGGLRFELRMPLPAVND